MKFKIGDKVKVLSNVDKWNGQIGEVFQIRGDKYFVLLPGDIGWKHSWSEGIDAPEGFSLLCRDDCSLELEEACKMFTKKDLKSGMLVKTREEKIYIILRNNNNELHAVREDSYFRMETIKDSLESLIDHKHDIMQVWDAPYVTTLEELLTRKGQLLYQRPSQRYLVIHSFNDGTLVKQGDILTVIRECEPDLYNDYQTKNGVTVETSLDNLVKLED